MNAEAEGRAAAERFRQDHHLGVQPLGDLISLIEQTAGVDVAVLDAGPDEHGLTMRDPVRGVIFIGVARTLRPMRRRSTLAHELGHVQFEDWLSRGDLGVRRPEETRADAFARHLLVPLAGLRELLGAPTIATQPMLSAVVQRFLVSPALAAIALEQAGYIGAAAKREWMGLTTPRLAVRFGWSDQYRALQAEADQRRAPQRLLARSIKAYAEGVLSAAAIGTLRGLPVEVVEAELREAGVVRAGQNVAWAAASDLPEVRVDMAALDEALNASGDATAESGVE